MTRSISDMRAASGQSAYSHDLSSSAEESDGGSLYSGTRNSSLNHTTDLLNEEEEREKLLANLETSETLRHILSGRATRKKGKGLSTGTESARAKKRSREPRRAVNKLEEGRQSSSDISDDSSDVDQRQLALVQDQKRANRKWKIYRNVGLFLAISIFFFVLLSVAYRASNRSHRQVQSLLHNGTSSFAPTTIVISLDGFRADFLYLGLTPTLNAFVGNGVSPKYMLPSFPSVTFPNHYTLVTGLYPESHGIVGNSFWDPHLKEEFYYTDPARSLQPKWWGGEPIWLTAERQGVRTAIHMWPGSEAHIGAIEPMYVDKYNGSELLSVKVERILGLLDLPGVDTISDHDTTRPQFIAAYVPVVDAMGHKFGPNSTEILKTIQEVDNMFHDLVHGLEKRNLTDIVNLIVVSDHGMATTDISRLIQLETIVDPNEIEHADGWPLYGLRPKKLEDLDRLYHDMRAKAESSGNFDVYLRDKDMPERYHFSKNDRIAPLWIVPKTGWAIVTYDEFDVSEGVQKHAVYHPRGLHGYDHEHPLMRAIFIARGPAFPHSPGSRLEPFQNIELYNILCDTLGINPAPNNGTLRLPLKPVGLHTDLDAPPSEIPPDPPISGSNATTSTPATTMNNLTTSNMQSLFSMSSSASFIGSITGNPPQPTNIDEGIVKSGSPSPEAAEKTESWWDWIKDQFDNAKEWGEHLLSKPEGSPGKNS